MDVWPKHSVGQFSNMLSFSSEVTTNSAISISKHAGLTYDIGGVFAQRAHSATYYDDYPGNNPENHAPAESCTINSNLKNSNI